MRFVMDILINICKDRVNKVNVGEMFLAAARILLHGLNQQLKSYSHIEKHFHCCIHVILSFFHVP